MLGEVLAEIYKFDATVLVAIAAVFISSLVIYLLRPFGSRERKSSDAQDADTKAKEEEEDDYLQEVARCARRLANHTPRPEEYPDFVKPAKNTGEQEYAKSSFSRLDDLVSTSEDGDSMIVNLPDDLEEEQELELMDLTADDISVEQESETDSDLSPQDMAEIAEELNTSMMSIDSLDIDAEDTESTNLLTEPSEIGTETLLAEDLARVCVANNSKKTPSGIEEMNKVSSEKTEVEGTSLLDQQDTPLLKNCGTDSSKCEIEDIAVVSSNCTNCSTNSHSSHCSASPDVSPKRVNQQKYEEVSSQLTEEEREMEIRAQQEQLNKIRELMQSSPGTFGEISDEDLNNQFKLYCM